MAVGLATLGPEADHGWESARGLRETTPPPPGVSRLRPGPRASAGQQNATTVYDPPGRNRYDPISGTRVLIATAQGFKGARHRKKSTRDYGLNRL